MSIKVVFVCLGNICRSPTAEGVMRKLVEEANLDNQITVDSCGTASFHIGKQADARAIAACAKQNIDISCLQARQLSQDDNQANYIMAMDRSNLTNIQACLPNFPGKLSLLLSYHPPGSGFLEVPDPYYDDDKAFADVLLMIQNACQSLLETIIKDHSLC